MLVTEWHELRSPDFAKLRERMRGNALFDVGKDAARPMLVNVGGHVLQDIGTVFDVRRDATGDTLTVISGRVRVLNAPASAARGAADAWLQGDAVADLMAGQQIELGKAAAGAVHPVALAQVTTEPGGRPNRAASRASRRAFSGP